MSSPVLPSPTPMADSTRPELLLSLFRTMVLIRQCEEQLARAHSRGLVHGACHTYVGQEAIAAGVCAHLGAEDVVFSTHRGHGHALAKGMPPAELIAELTEAGAHVRMVAADVAPDQASLSQKTSFRPMRGSRLACCRCAPGVHRLISPLVLR